MTTTLKDLKSCCQQTKPYTSLTAKDGEHDKMDKTADKSQENLPSMRVVGVGERQVNKVRDNELLTDNLPRVSLDTHNNLNYRRLK